VELLRKSDFLEEALVGGRPILEGRRSPRLHVVEGRAVQPGAHLRSPQ